MAIVIFENKEQILTWVDVTAPSSTELTELSKTYDLNHFALSACLQPDHLPKHEDIEGTHFGMKGIVEENLYMENFLMFSLQKHLAVLSLVPLFYHVMARVVMQFMQLS